MKKNYIYAYLTVFIWATMAAVTKMLLSDIPNLEALSISSAFAFLFLLIINIKNGSIKEMKRYSVKDYSIMAGLGFIGLFMYSALYYYGLTQLSSQEACILNYLWPIMLVLFSCIILKEKMTFMKGIAMFFSFLGIVVLSTTSKFSGLQSTEPVRPYSPTYIFHLTMRHDLVYRKRAQHIRSFVKTHKTCSSVPYVPSLRESFESHLSDSHTKTRHRTIKARPKQER
mgnify:CR=1 FL=1